MILSSKGISSNLNISIGCLSLLTKGLQNLAKVWQDQQKQSEYAGQRIYRLVVQDQGECVLCFSWCVLMYEWVQIPKYVCVCMSFFSQWECKLWLSLFIIELGEWDFLRFIIKHVTGDIIWTGKVNFIYVCVHMLWYLFSYKLNNSKLHLIQAHYSYLYVCFAC